MASQGTGAAGGGSEGKGEGKTKIGKPFRICSVADTCDYCGQYSTTKRCSLCHDARYCDLICLQNHRSDHRGQCLLIQEDRAKKEAKEAKERARAKVLEGLGEELFDASFLGKAARVSQLLKLGIDVNFVMTKEGWAKGGFPLLAAVQEGHVEVVRLLLAAEGVAVNQARTDDSNFPLYKACEKNHIEVVRMLLACEGVSVNQAFINGAFPLIIACQLNHIEVVRLLLAAEGVEVNQACANDDGYFPLYKACSRNHVEVVRLLLACEGVAVNQATTTGATALFMACQNNHVEVVRLLLAVEGVSVNQACTDSNFPLFMACQNNHVEVVCLLLAAHTQVNQVVIGGWSACHVASQLGHVQVLEMLLEAGADVERKSDDGVTALDLAIECKHSATQAVIRKHVAKLEAEAKAKDGTEGK